MAIDVRPPINLGDDAVYVEEHDVTVVKSEECCRRRVFRKSDLPYLGPIVEIVIPDSESDSESTSRIAGMMQSDDEEGESNPGGQAKVLPEDVERMQGR